MIAKTQEEARKRVILKRHLRKNGFSYFINLLETNRLIEFTDLLYKERDIKPPNY